MGQGGQGRAPGATLVGTSPRPVPASVVALLGTLATRASCWVPANNAPPGPGGRQSHRQPALLLTATPPAPERKTLAAFQLFPRPKPCTHKRDGGKKRPTNSSAHTP